MLNGVDFVVERGTIHGLIGPNGSGKSTLVDLIAGRLRPQAGTIEIEGVSLGQRPRRTRAAATCARFSPPCSCASCRRVTTSWSVSTAACRASRRVRPSGPCFPLPAATRGGMR